MGRVALLEGDRLLPGAVSLAQLVLERRWARLRGDRVIPARSLGDAHHRGAPSWSIRSVRRATGARRGAWPSSARLPRARGGLLARLLTLESGFVDLARFGLAHNMRPAEVDKLLAEAGGVRVQGFGFSAETLGAARADFIKTLEAHHKTSADAPGLTPDRLRVALSKRWPAEPFRALLEREIAARTVALDGGFVHLPGHSLKLGARDEVLWKKISADLIRDRFKPPRVRDFAQSYGEAEPNVRKLLRQMARLGPRGRGGARPVLPASGGGRNDRHRPCAWQRLHRRAIPRQAGERPASWRS